MTSMITNMANSLKQFRFKNHCKLCKHTDHTAITTAIDLTKDITAKAKELHEELLRLEQSRIGKC